MGLEKEKHSESIDHLLIKKFFCENIPLDNNIITIKEEVKIGNRFADIYGKLKNGKEFVIEIQHTKISKEELIQRTIEYNQEGIFVLWILDGKGPYDRSPKNEKGLNFSVSEKELHSMYRGRVYYINATREGIETPPYALHFCPYIEKKISSFGMISYKKSKSKRSTVCCNIPSLELTLFRNKGFKLTRFLDENLKDECIREVSQFIYDYIAYQSLRPKEAKKLLSNGLVLGVLIKKFHEKYGLYLLFDALWYLKLLTIRDAKYMFNKELWLQKYIPI